MRTMILVIILVCLSMGWSVAGPIDHTVVISQGKTPVLQLKTHGKTVVTPIGEKTVVQTPDMFLHIWPQAEGATLAGTVARVSGIIKGDVLNFKTNKTEALKVGARTVNWFAGTGIEADDEDSSHAEVVVFDVGGRVFVACIHGEGRIEPAEHNAMLAALKTVESPK